MKLPSMMIGSALVALLALVAAGPVIASHEEFWTAVTAEQLKELTTRPRILEQTRVNGFVNASIVLAGTPLGEGRLYTVYITRNGQPGQDEGRWRIEGDRFCETWKVVRAGTERCWKLFRGADGTYYKWRIDTESVSHSFRARDFY